jgi:ABC-2 type transport system permease protein
MPDVGALLAGQLSYQVRLLLRSPRALAGGAVLPVLLLVIRGDAANVAGFAVLGVLSTAFITHAGGLVSARQRGVLKRWRAMPLPRWCWFAGRIGATVLVALAGGAVTVLVGLASYGFHLDAGAALSLAVVLALGGATWACIGTAATAFIPNAEAAWPLLGATYLPIVLLSGAFGAVSREPGWLAALMRHLPAQPVIEGAERALHGAPFPALTPRDIAVLAAWTAAGFLVSQRFFRWR